MPNNEILHIHAADLVQVLDELLAKKMHRQQVTIISEADRILVRDKDDFLITNIKKISTHETTSG